MINNWPIKKFLAFIITIQIATLGLISLDSLNIQVPLLRQFVCFFYLTFIPGILILRILKLHKLNLIESFSYSIGISISFIMFLGLLINIFYPLMGFDNPISIVPLILTITVIVLILSILSYISDEEIIFFEKINLKVIFNPKILLLILMPFSAIFGTYILNIYGINYIQLLTLMIILTFPIIIIKFYNSFYYPFSVFIISLTILYHASLISFYLWGFDVWTEYSLSNLVLINSIWNSAIEPASYNSMLSVVFLPSIYALILDINIIWVFKIIYPFIFSIVPLGLFIVYKKQTNNQIAFLSVFFIITMYVFYSVLPATPRQQIGELFLTLIMLLLFSNRKLKANETILLLLFGTSIIVSHYGISYIFIIILILCLVISLIRLRIINIFKFKKSSKNSEIFFIKNKNYIIFLVVFTFAWFIYISNSTIFNLGVKLGYNILNSLNDIFSLSQGASIATRNMPLLISIERNLHLVSQFLIFVGLIKIVKKDDYNLKIEFKIFCIASFVIAVFGLTLPFFSNAMNADRLYHMSLFFLAPLFVIGTITILRLSKKIIYILIKKEISLSPYYLISIFLMIFFLFSSSFIPQIFDQPKQGRFALDNNVDFPRLNYQEIKSAYWINNTKDDKIKVYSDLNKAQILNCYLNYPTENYTFVALEMHNYEKPSSSSYILISTYTIKNNELFVLRDDYGKNILNIGIYLESKSLVVQASKIYDNGKSWVLK